MVGRLGVSNQLQIGSGMMEAMVIKHADEWKELVNLAKKSKLTADQAIFLLALREVEDGEPHTAFNVKSVQNTTLERQALWAIGSILENERRWQTYLLKNGWIDFLDFFITKGGQYGTGWRLVERNMWVNDMKYFIKLITKEMSDGLGRIDYMGK